MQDINLTIIKFEGLGDLSHAQCLIYSNSELIDRIFPSSPVPSSIRCASSKLKVVLLDTPSSLPICSVSFNLSIFHNSGLNWLPLFLNDEDFLPSVPEEVGLPRILIDVTPAILTPVLELTESSDTLEENLEDFPTDDFTKANHKNTELMIKVIDLESSLNSARRQFEEEVEEMEKGYKDKINEILKENEKLRLNQAKQAKSLADIIKENQSLEEKFHQISEEKRELFSKLERYERLYEDVKLREDSILMLLEEKDKEIMKVKEKNKENLKICEESKVCVFKTKIDLKKTQNDKNGIGRFKVLEKIDEKIKKTLKILNLDGLLKLSDEFLYLLGSKKLNIVCKKENIYVKSGANNMKTLEAYISSNCSQDIQAYLVRKKVKDPVPATHRRSITIFDIDKLQNSVISKTFDSKLNTSRRTLQKVLNSPVGKSTSPLHKNRKNYH